MAALFGALDGRRGTCLMSPVDAVDGSSTAT